MAMLRRVWRVLGIRQTPATVGYSFSEPVRRVLAQARAEASRLGHPYIGTEHFLLAILRDSDGIATKVVVALGAVPADLATEVDSIVTLGKEGTASGPNLPYTSRAKKTLELSMAEARELGHKDVGVEHLLLGILREEKNIAAQVLNDAGITLDLARKETLRLLGTT